MVFAEPQMPFPVSGGLVVILDNTASFYHSLQSLGVELLGSFVDIWRAMRAVPALCRSVNTDTQPTNYPHRQAQIMR